MPYSLLILAPHPDDETLGPGGTLAQRVQHGAHATIVVITDGSNLFRRSQWKIETHPTPAETSARRKEETRRAIAILAGPHAALHFLDVEDGQLPDQIAPVAARLAEIIRPASPDEIFVTSEYEAHPDHVAAHTAARLALHQTHSPATLLRYLIALRPGLALAALPDPHIAIDITPQLDLKRRAVSQFNSHLKIVAQGQTEPFFKDITPWCQPTETFLLDLPGDGGKRVGE